MIVSRHKFVKWKKQKVISKLKVQLFKETRRRAGGNSSKTTRKGSNQNQTIHFFQYKIERPRDESIEEPEEESSESESEEEEEDEEEIDEEKEREREYLEELSKKIAIIMTSIIAGFFSMYLLTSFVHLKYVF